MSLHSEDLGHDESGCQEFCEQDLRELGQELEDAREGEPGCRPVAEIEALIGDVKAKLNRITDPPDPLERCSFRRHR